MYGKGKRSNLIEAKSNQNPNMKNIKEHNGDWKKYSVYT